MYSFRWFNFTYVLQKVNSLGATMLQHNWFACLFILSAIPTSLYCQAGEPEIPVKIVQDWKMQFDKSISLSGTQERKFHNQINNRSFTIRYEFKQNDSCAMFTKIDSNKPESEIVAVMNPLYVFELNRKPGSERVLLKETILNSNGIVSSCAQPVRNSIYVEMHPQFCFGMKSLDEIFASGSLKIKSFEHRNTEDGPRAYLLFAGSYKVPGSKDTTIRTSGTLVLDPALLHGIEVATYEDETTANGKIAGIVKYEIQYRSLLTGGCSVLKTVQKNYKGIRVQSNTPINYIESYNCDYQMKKIDSKSFQLAAFDLPEPAEIVNLRPSKGYLSWVIAIGIFFTLCYGIFFYMRKRSLRGLTGQIKTAI